METRNIVLHFAAVLSALTQAALFGIIITIAVVELPIERLRPFVLASSALNGLLLVTLLVILARILGDLRTTSFEQWFYSASFTLSTTAIALSFYVLASVWSIYKFKSSDLSTSVTACLVVTGIVLCSLTLISQFITHILLLFPRQHDADDRSPMPSPKRLSATLKSLTSPMTPSKAQLTPYTPSINSLHSLRSSRQGSVNQVFGPLGSKTRLLITHSLHPAESQSQLYKREPSLEIACRGEIAEMVDTSEPYELSSSPPLRMNLTRTMLETIPGSRPVSPAKPLEPYLWEEVTPEDFPLPDSPSLSRAASPVNMSASPTEHHFLPFPPMIGEFASSSQTHIHPLFRSDSPGPPPSTSPGTKVVASPYAGQVVGSDHALAKKLKTSRPGTPARSATPSMEKMEVVPNFSRPGASSRSGTRPTDMF